jgi:hypothetical protein
LHSEHACGIFAPAGAGNFSGTVINIFDLQKNVKSVQSAEYLKVSSLFKNDGPLQKECLPCGKSAKTISLSENSANRITIKTSICSLTGMRRPPSMLQQAWKAAGGAFCLGKHDYDLLKTADVQIEPDIFLKDNAKLELGDGIIRVLHTPGHTRGSLCFYVKDADILFSGRTLEKDGYGTIWGPSSMSYMLFSLKRLDGAISSAAVYPGRGESTTMRKESWLNCLRSH